MAKKKKEAEKKIVLEREYNVPLRREFLKVPRYKRAKKAGTALKEFLIKHMKSDNVKIGKYANLKIWENGIKNPPHHIKVLAKKDEEGLVTAELVGAPVEKKLPEPKKAAKKEVKAPSETDKLEEKLEVKKEEKAEAAKEIQKEELKEAKKDLKTEHHHAPKQAAEAKKVEAKPSAPKGKGKMSKP